MQTLHCRVSLAALCTPSQFHHLLYPTTNYFRDFLLLKICVGEKKLHQIRYIVQYCMLVMSEHFHNTEQKNVVLQLESSIPEFH